MYAVNRFVHAAIGFDRSSLPCGCFVFSEDFGPSRGASGRRLRNVVARLRFLKETACHMRKNAHNFSLIFIDGTMDDFYTEKLAFKSPVLAAQKQGTTFKEVQIRRRWFGVGTRTVLLPALLN